MNNASDLSPSLAVIITRPKLHKALLEEISTIRQQGKHLPPTSEISELAEGAIGITTPNTLTLLTPLAFARQILPNAQQISGESISELAHGIFTFIDTHLDQSDATWAIHIYEPSTSEDGIVHKRAMLIEESLKELLAKKRRGIQKRHTTRVEDAHLLVQGVLADARSLYVSCDEVSSYPSIRHHLAGYIDIEDDKSPPSRAFKKLVEARALWHLPFQATQSAVDLGASPGGWTYIAVSWGLTVTAVDRSPLEEKLMRNKRVRFTQGDAFSWCPTAQNSPLDWLLCDVISAPERTATLLQEWIGNRRCRNFCVTMKFKGEPAVSTVMELKEWMSTHTEWFDVAPLTNNKNEVTWVGRIE